MHYYPLAVIYRPDGLQDIVLCQYDDVMEELVTVKPSVQFQREPVIGSPWMHQAARGNASPADVFLPSCGRLSPLLVLMPGD